MKSTAIALALLTSLAACVDDTDLDDAERRKPRPSTVDAGTGTTGGSTGSFSCFSTANPSASCSSPSQCCFGSSVDHSGSCSSSSCSYGAISCDGPEDCSDGLKCCATITSNGIKVGCAAECLPYFQSGEELCHEPSVCSGGRWCITAWGTQPALPRTLAICR